MGLNPVKNIWWLNPVWIYFMWFLFTVYCSTIDSKGFYEMYEEPMYIDWYNVLIYALFFLFFTLGFYSYRICNRRPLTVYDISTKKIIKVFYLLYSVVICAYIIWFSNLAIIYGGNIVLGLFANLTGYSSLFFGNGGRISGVTTLTEMAIIVAPLNTYLCFVTKDKHFRWMFVVLVVLSILRAAIFSERLAFIEVVLPSIVICAYFCPVFKRRIMAMAPVFAVIGLLVVFGIFEYYRSWPFYRAAYDDDIVSFVTDRVFGYYSVAVNTETIQINFLEPKYFFYNTLNWLWQIPGFSLLPDIFMDSPKVNVLEKWGNPEFNNPGGLLFAYIDFGYFGLIIQFVFGRLMGFFYKGYCRHGFIDSLWFSASVLCMMELPRYFFWGAPRAFFAILAMLIIQKYLGRRKNSLVKQYS